MRSDFGVIIISHGRPHCSTYEKLRGMGYTGKIYVVADDEDKTIDEYREVYGDDLHVFHKVDDFDTADNFDGPKTVGVYARNECIKVAREKGLKFYAEMDDDLKSLVGRYEKDGILASYKIKDIDAVFEAICHYMEEAPVDCVGFSNAGDFIGGKENVEKKAIDHRIYNVFILRTDYPIKWHSRHADDTITTVEGLRNGRQYMKLRNIQAAFDVWSGKNGSKKGGGSISTYDALGSYRLWIYGIIHYPDCIRLKMTSNHEFDYGIREVNLCPKLVSSRLQK